MKEEHRDNKGRTGKRDKGATNSPERSGRGESTNERGDAGELPLDPEEQTRSWKEKEDSSLDTTPEKDREKGANWAKKEADRGKLSGKEDETADEDDEGWNAKNYGEGSGFRQPNTLDDQLNKAAKARKEKKDK